MIEKLKSVSRVSLFSIIPIIVFASNCLAVVAGDLRVYSTRNSIGIEWDISADENHNASCMVQYKREDSSDWLDALGLYRVDFGGENMMAGSVLFLQPGTQYDIRLAISDSDGGSQTREVSFWTKSDPELPRYGQVYHVIPGHGGGTGTVDDPFRGIASAQSAASPGDTFLLGNGTYSGETVFGTSGTSGQYIVWKGKNSGGAILETIRVDADHLWLENLTVQGHQYGLRTYRDPQDVVVVKNTFSGCHYCIYLNHGGTGWYIGDNVIIGDVEPGSGSFSGEGIELQHSDDHTVLHNSISKVADGISYPGRNCDIFGNEIFDVSDDGIEPDYGESNNRIYQNRISNAYHNGISFQPMNGAPWYIIRNQVAAPVESALKFRDAVDRSLIAHNTFVGWQGAQKYGSHFLLSVHSRNNLWISMTDWYAWENGSGGAANWKTDLDYDGFDWGNNSYAIKWGTRYETLSAFSSATGLEQNGIRIDKNTCLSGLEIPSAPPASMKVQHIQLKSGCAAIDAGQVLNNINTEYRGTAPDLGAHELGASLQHYGPRTSSPPPPGGGDGRATPFLHLLLGE